MPTLSETGIIPLSQIELGERRRKNYGDIASLAKGIKRVGLLHPLIVQRIDGSDDHFLLVVGARRYKALELLKVKDVPVRLFEDLSEKELRDIELEENENRKDFTVHERQRDFKANKRLKQDAATAREVMGNFPTTSQSKGGPKPKRGVKQADVAEALGVDRKTVDHAEQHVETAEAYPFMQGDDWKQYHVLEARELIHRLPESEQPLINHVVMAAGKAPSAGGGLDLLRNFVIRPAAERTEIYRLAQSKDRRERDLAITSAAARPPMPDSRTTFMNEVIQHMKAAHRLLKDSAKEFPGDPLIPKIDAVMGDVTELIRLIKIQEKERSNGLHFATAVQ